MRGKKAFLLLLAAVMLAGAVLVGAAPSQILAPQQEQGGAEPSLLVSTAGSQTSVSVTFIANGGRGTVPETVTAQKGETVVLPGAELTVRVGSNSWRFVGWSPEVSASTPAYAPGEEITLTSDLALYAIYSSADCKVTYQVNGSVTTETVTVGETPAKVPALPTDYVGWRDSSGRTVDPALTEIFGDQVFVAYKTPALNTLTHDKYMDGSSDGMFHPDQSMTRAEVAQVIYDLLKEKPTGQVSFTDVPSGAWYADEVGALGALGILAADSNGAFRPNDPITREEFAVILSNFIPSGQRITTFTDVSVSSASYEAIGTAASYGLFSGYPDGSFRPTGALTRAEATAVFNKLLGRAADPDVLAAADNIRIFPDVPNTHWAYGQIMEATVSHGFGRELGSGEYWTTVVSEHTVLADGYYRFDGWLYRVQDGMFLRNVTVDNFTYDENGRYTTGSATLDAKLHAIVDKYTNDSMTRDQKLRALYNYVRDNFTYLKRPLVSKGQTGWEPAYAEEFLTKGKGNCFSFSATYCLLVRQLGLPAYTVVGGLGRSASPHGWVEIKLDGTTYMFDTQLEWRYLHDYGLSGYNLFKMLPSKAPFTYTR